MALKHVHQYERTEVGKKGHIIFKCMLPGCSHFLPVANMIINKVSLCWGVCGGETIYSKDDYERALKHPMCEDCRDLRKQQREELTKIA